MRPVGPQLFHADGRTDMTKLTVSVRNFANTPKIHQAKQFMVARHKAMTIY